VARGGKRRRVSGCDRGREKVPGCSARPTIRGTTMKKIDDIMKSMTYFYLITLGFENVRIIEGGYAELVGDFKPGKLLKHITQRKSKE
jgi:hypothetical protein